jgi:signal transduction histidine kinase
MLLQTQQPEHEEQARGARERTGERIPRDRVPRERRPAPAPDERVAATGPDECVGATGPDERAGAISGHDDARDPRGAAVRAGRADRPGTTAAGERGAAAAPTARRLTPARTAIVGLAALLAGVAITALELRSDHHEARAVWAVFAPAVGWSFVGTGLYAWRRRPENRTGALMVRLGLAWFLFALDAADAPALYTLALVAGGTWGGAFLHLGLSFPAGRLETRLDRRLTIAGYVVFPLAFVPALLFSAPHDLGCPDCPANVLLVRRDPDLAHALTAFGAALYLGLFAVVLVRSVRRWRATGPQERLQLTPVYVCALLTFLLVTVARAGAGEAAWWAAFVATGVTPFAFLGGLLRSHVSRLDAELRERLDDLRQSRARLVEAGDAARQRLERDLHDGAQARLVALGLLLGRARVRASGDAALEDLLTQAVDELHTSLDELRELARGIHPAVLSDRGLEPALRSLVTRAPVPVNVDAPVGRLPGAIESAAYFVASEGLQNVAKYAHATRAQVTVRHAGDRLRVEVADDGIGGADASRGSGLRGLADRVAALDGKLALDSPAGGGTRLRAEIPCGAAGTPAHGEPRG